MNRVTQQFNRKRTVGGIWRGIHLVNTRIRYKWRNYLFQCGLASLALMAILLVIDAVNEVAIVVSLASSAFMIFVIPHSAASNPRRVVGGQLIGVIVGWVALSFLGPPPDNPTFQSILFIDGVAAAAIGISIIIMVLTDTTHPPAAGTVLGLALGEGATSTIGTNLTILFILVTIALLSTVHMILRPKLTNLI